MDDVQEDEPGAELSPSNEGVENEVTAAEEEQPPPDKKRGFDERRNAANKIELDPEAVEKARKLVRQAKKRQKKKKKKLAEKSESE